MCVCVPNTLVCVAVVAPLLHLVCHRPDWVYVICVYVIGVYGCMGVWVYGCMGVWVCGCVGVWHRCVWVYGCVGVYVCVIHTHIHIIH
jgi:hypothetical protein